MIPMYIYSGPKVGLPVLIDGTVAGDNYLEILRDVVVQQLRTKAKCDELHFQQDGAPPRYSRTV